MQKSIFKKVTYIIILTLTIFMISTISEAATLNLSSSKPEITIGETFTVTITAGNGAGRIDLSATNATLSSSGEFLDNNSATVTVTPTSTGTVTVTATGVLSDYTIEEDQNFSKSITVNVKEKEVTPPPQQEPEEPDEPTTPPLTTTETKSDNANLKSITTSQQGLTPAFNKSTTEYFLNVGNDIESIEVNAEPEDSKATVTVSGNTDLLEGENKVKITVKAEDGTTKTYNITVIKAEKLNMFLDKLEIFGVSEEKDDIEIKLEPKFNPETFDYIIDLEENIKSLSINATSIVDDAIIEITGAENLEEGANIVTITLKMPEGEDKIEYKIIVNKPTAGLNEETEENNKNDGNKSFGILEIGIIACLVLIIIIIVVIVIKKRNSKFEEEFVTKKDIFENEENDIEEEGIKSKTGKSGKHF